MDLDKVVFTEAAYDKIAAILDQTFGEVDFNNLTEHNFALFVSATIRASYAVGFRDGEKSATVDK